MLHALPFIPLSTFSLEHEVRELQIMLESYLKVAKKRFIDNVIQVLNREMNKIEERVRECDGLQFTEGELLNILSEDSLKKQKREFLVKTIETAKMGLEDFESNVFSIY